MSRTAASVFNQLGGKVELPLLPASILELQLALLDPDNDAKALAGIIKQDPLMAVEVLMMANGRQANATTPITSIQNAVAYVGRSALSEIVVMASLKSYKFSSRAYTPEMFWHSSKATGLLAEHLWHLIVGGEGCEQAYLAGALCNIGKIVAAICIPEKIDLVLLSANKVDTLSTWREAESKNQVPDHAVLGEIAAVIWGLPDYAVKAARYHHEEDQILAQNDILLQIVAFANQLSHWQQGEPHLVEEALLKELQARFKLNDGKVEPILAGVQKILKNKALAA